DTGGTLGSTAVLTQGIIGLDFYDARTGSCAATAYNPGDACTIDVGFWPANPGARYGAAELLDGSGNVVATAYIYGTGSGPQMNFLPGSESTVGSGLSHLRGVAADGNGNIYIADSGNNVVLEETWQGGGYSLNTVASVGLSLPWGVAVDGAGNVYIADFGNSRVLKETLSAGSYSQTTVTTSVLNHPADAAVDGAGNVYIADSGNNRILKETPSAGSYTETTVPSSVLSNPLG